MFSISISISIYCIRIFIFLFFSCESKQSVTEGLSYDVSSFPLKYQINYFEQKIKIKCKTWIQSLLVKDYVLHVVGSDLQRYWRFNLKCLSIHLKDSFETDKTFLRSVNPEFERKFDVQNRTFGWVRFQNRFFKNY